MNPEKHEHFVGSVFVVLYFSITVKYLIMNMSELIFTQSKSLEISENTTISIL